MMNMRIKESDIPIDLLYHDKINDFKEKEKTENAIPKAITFTVVTNPDSNDLKNFV